MILIRIIISIALIAFCKGDFDIPENLKPHVELLHNTCVAETEVDEGELVVSFLNESLKSFFPALIKESRKGYIPMDDKLACYIHCLFIKTHMVSLFL